MSTTYVQEKHKQNKEANEIIIKNNIYTDLPPTQKQQEKKDALRQLRKSKHEIWNKFLQVSQSHLCPDVGLLSEAG